MLIFVANIPVYIEEYPSSEDFTFIADLGKDHVTLNKITGRVLLKNATFQEILAAIEYLQNSPIELLEKLSFLVKSKQDFKKFIKDHVEIIKAAGGIVENSAGEILLMKRLGFWDLPKGKAEKREKSEVTAIREVEEECNITATIQKKVVCTWHSYKMKKKLVFKKTRWYSMKLISDRKMKPQKEEGIEELKWMNKEEWNIATQNTYKSIIHVLYHWENSRSALFTKRD